MLDTASSGPPPQAAVAKYDSNNSNGNTTEDTDIEKVTRTSQKAGLLSRRRLLGAIEKDHGDLALLACCLVTGMIDAASFANWGVFVGMQTGNTVILGLSAAGLPNNPYGWLTTLVSITAFLLGAFTTFRVSKVITPDGVNSNRLWTGLLFFFQGILVLIAAALATPTGLIPQNPAPSSRHEREPPSVIQNIRIVSLLPPLAFQSGMQIASSRLMGFNELPVNVLTSTYCDIMGDFNLLALNNVRRNRRVTAVFLLLIGAISSGWLLRSSGGLESVLYIAAGVKIVTAFGVWVLMPPAKESVA